MIVSIALGAGLLIAGAGLFSVIKLTGKLREVTSVTAAQIDNVSTIRSRIWQGETYKRGAFLAASLGDAAVRSRMERDYTASMAVLRSRIQAARPLLETDDQRRDFGELEGMITEWDDLVRQFIALTAQGRQSEVGPLVAKIVPLVDKMDRSSLAVVESYRTELKQDAADGDRTSTLSWLVIVSLGIVLLACGVLCVLVVRALVRSLGSSVESLKQGSGQLASVSAQIASSSQSLSQMASEQAASLEETSASTQEIQSMTARNADNAREASSKTVDVGVGLNSANESLQKMIVSMDAIMESSNKVSRIIKVIDEIAFQTNILALNAAVEAARAGEAGMGFAVVADEVRNLAQRCAQAARDTTGLIEEAIQTSQEGKARVDRVAASVASVSQEAAAVKVLAEEVNHGSDEQARGIEQIAKAVGEMERVTQQVASHSEESAAAAEELSSQAAHVDEVVNRLAVLIGGRSAAA